LVLTALVAPLGFVLVLSFGIQRMKASTACQACHGGDGISVLNNAPNLAGQKTAYLAQQLHSFKSGDRKHDMMNPIAKLLSDSDIENLAAFWNSLPAAGDKRETVAAAAQARKSRMMFPVEFPKGFRVYRTDESAEGNSIGSFYANSAAWQAAQLPVETAGGAAPNRLWCFSRSFHVRPRQPSRDFESATTHL